MRAFIFTCILLPFLFHGSLFLLFAECLSHHILPLLSRNIFLDFILLFFQLYGVIVVCIFQRHALCGCVCLSVRVYVRACVMYVYAACTRRWCVVCLCVHTCVNLLSNARVRKNAIVCVSVCLSVRVCTSYSCDVACMQQLIRLSYGDEGKLSVFERKACKNCSR